MSVLSQPTPQISVGPPPTLTYQVSVTNGQAYTLTVFQTLNGTNTVVVSPTSYTGTGSLQTYTFTSPVTSYAYFTRVLIGVTTTDSTSVLYYSPYQGPQGVQGNPGTVGGQGPIGPVGPQGPQGLQGVVSVTNYVTCNSLITSGTSSGTVNAHSTAVLTPAGALSGITTISLPSVAAAAAVSTIYKAVSSPDNTITSWGDGSGWRFNFLGNAARTSNVLTLVDNGNVGINCNAPAYTLDVGGQTRISGGNTSTNTPSMILVGGGNAVGHGAMIALGNPSMSVSNDFVQLSSKLFGSSGNIAQGWFSISTRSATNSSDGNAYVERITVSNIGLTTATAVGIAQTTPAYTLDVGGSINSTGSIYVRGTNYLITYGGTSGYTYMNTDTNGYGYMRAAGSYLFMGAGGTSTLAVTNNAMSINTGAGPNYTLDVGGTTRLTTASSLASTAPDGGANHGLMLVSTKAPDSGKTAYSMALGVDSGTGYGYINAAGNTALQPILLQSRGGGVGIGLTTAPAYTLDVNGTTRLGSPVNGALSTGFYHNPLGSIAFALTGQTTACNAGGGVFGVYSTDATGSNVGGSIALGGRSYDFGGGANYQTYAKIWGVSTDGGYHGAFVVSTQNDGALYERMRIDNGGNVGIGTVNPEYKLHVAGNARLANFVFNDNRLSLSYWDTDTGFDWISDGVFRIMNNESETLRISSGGIDMYNHDISGAKIIYATTFCNAAQTIYTSGNDLFMTSGFMYVQSNWQIQPTNNAGTRVYGISFSNGNVGIGNGAPGTKLDVVGSVRWAQGSGDTYQIFSTSNGNYNFGAQNTYDPAAYGIIQVTHTLANNGGVGAADGQWAYTMVQSGTRVNGVGMMPSLGKIVIGAGASVLEGSSNGITVDVTNKRLGIACNAPAYSLDVIGTINATGDVIAYSDARAKTNVATISNALSKVNAMRGVTYAMKTEPDVQKIGVIAQEVEQIIPELVSTDSTPEQKKSVAYGNITAVLIEAIKELTKRLETLERR